MVASIEPAVYIPGVGGIRNEDVVLDRGRSAKGAHARVLGPRGHVGAVSDAVTFDYVVVGGGTAGVIVAAQRVVGDARVRLIEAGPSMPDRRGCSSRRAGASSTRAISTTTAANPPRRTRTSAFPRRGSAAAARTTTESPCCRPTRTWPRGGRGASKGGRWRSCARASTGCSPGSTSSATTEHEACTAAFVELLQQAGYPLRDYWVEPLQAGVLWVRFSRRGGIRQSSSVA